MRRREFVSFLGSASAVWPLAATAQQPAVPAIGFLSSRSPGEAAQVVAAFRAGLRETGFVEGGNLAIAFRWAEGHYDRLPALALELVDMHVALLFASGGPPAALAAKAATSTVPIVFSAVGDPVALGLVASLGRPGGNLTGMSSLTAPLGAKGIELMKALLPKAAVLAYLTNPTSPSMEMQLREAIAAADKVEVQLRVLKANRTDDLDAIFADFANLQASGLVIAGEPFLDGQRERIVALAARFAVVTCYAWRESVEAGGLMSYGNNLNEMYRQAAIYAGRILKGEKPANLPVVQPAKFELVLNLKAAKALGLAIPPLILARADEVIE